MMECRWLHLLTSQTSLNEWASDNIWLQTHTSVWCRWRKKKTQKSIVTWQVGTILGWLSRLLRSCLSHYTHTYKHTHTHTHTHTRTHAHTPFTYALTFLGPENSNSYIFCLFPAQLQVCVSRSHFGGLVNFLAG
jgi:hypothetical protein